MDVFEFLNGYRAALEEDDEDSNIQIFEEPGKLYYSNSYYGYYECDYEEEE